MNETTYRLIIFCWRIVFHQEPSQEAIRQIKQFFIFGTGMMAAKFLSIASQIIMGRQFGPEIYGQITMILLLSSYLAMPIVNGWGLAFTKIAAKEHDLEKKYQALKSLLLIVFLCGVVTILFLAALQQPLATLLDISPQLMRLSLVMTVFYAWWILTKQIAQGFQKWHAYIIIENIWAAGVLISIICLIFQGEFSISTASGAFFACYLFSGFTLNKVIYRSIFSKINSYYSHDILYNGFFLLLNGLIGTAVFSIDRILINRNLGEKDVGIYQAHFLSTYGIINAFITIFITYIFPILCRKNNIQILLNKICIIQYPITVIITTVIGGISLWLYSFQVYLFLFITFCLFNAIQFHYQLKTWYFTSKGVCGSRIVLWSQVIFLCVNIITLIILVEYIGIAAGGASLAVASVISLVYLIKSEKSL